MWVGSATCSTLPVASNVRPPPTWYTRGKSSEHTYCFNFKALCLVSEGRKPLSLPQWEASFLHFGLQFLISPSPHTHTHTHTHTEREKEREREREMSKQPVAARDGASSVAKGVHLFLPNHSEPTTYEVTLHLPVIMPLLMEVSYSGNKAAAWVPPLISSTPVHSLSLDIVY